MTRSATTQEVRVRPLKSDCKCFRPSWLRPIDAAPVSLVALVPDGRIDLTISASAAEPFHIRLMGLGSTYDEVSVDPKTKIFAVSLNPIAAEYFFDIALAPLLNQSTLLPYNFWELNEADLHDFDRFCKKISARIEELQQVQQADQRKLRLFDMIFASHGAASVQQIADTLHWSSRQINRYFSQQFGLSLKAYCNIIRFRSSFQHLKQGKLFPEEHFTDQSHFIRQVKKLSGVSPKLLAKNKNDRFIQFSALQRK